MNSRKNAKPKAFVRQLQREFQADRRITSGLAIQTLKKALESQPQIKEEPIFHSCNGYRTS